MNGMKQINLQDYGLNRNFITQSMEYHDLYLARIISQEKNFYQAVCVNGVLFAEVSGKRVLRLLYNLIFPQLVISLCWIVAIIKMVMLLFIMCFIEKACLCVRCWKGK